MASFTFYNLLSGWVYYGRQQQLDKRKKIGLIRLSKRGIENIILISFYLKTEGMQTNTSSKNNKLVESALINS